jgi:hypothetical protein
VSFLRAVGDRLISLKLWIPRVSWDADVAEGVSAVIARAVGVSHEGAVEREIREIFAFVPFE